MPHAEQVKRACALYNRFTDPRALRTDAEHDRNRRAARRVSRWLFKNARKGRHYHESESGKLFTV